MITDIHYQEIPSTFIDANNNFLVSYGLHVIIERTETDYPRKFYLSSSYLTSLDKFKLDEQFSRYDILAFHIYRYIKERCNFSISCTHVLWVLLCRSNSFIKAIKKFFKLIIRYYENYSD